MMMVHVLVFGRLFFVMCVYLVPYVISDQSHQAAVEKLSLFLNAIFLSAQGNNIEEPDIGNNRIR